jgi:DNA-binding MurR/RpiR family transcriptional regulator
VVLFTDQWGSPIENVADFCFRSMVQVPSSWDSMISLNFIVETIVAQIHRKAPEDTVKRIADLETLISDTEMFEK